MCRDEANAFFIVNRSNKLWHLKVGRNEGHHGKQTEVLGAPRMKEPFPQILDTGNCDEEWCLMREKPWQLLIGGFTGGGWASTVEVMKWRRWMTERMVDSLQIFSKATYSNSYIDSYTDGGGWHARCRTSTSGAVWGWVYCSRTLQHADQGNPTCGLPITRH